MSTISLPEAGTEAYRELVWGCVAILGVLSRGQAWAGWGKTRVLVQNGGTEVPALLEGKLQSRGLVRGPMGRVGKGRQDP